MIDFRDRRAIYDGRIRNWHLRRVGGFVSAPADTRSLIVIFTSGELRGELKGL